MEVPAGLEVRVVENTGTVTHLVLTARPRETGGELSEEQLDRAAGATAHHRPTATYPL